MTTTWYFDYPDTGNALRIRVRRGKMSEQWMPLADAPQWLSARRWV